jgi:hypothetical protein
LGEVGVSEGGGAAGVRSFVVMRFRKPGLAAVAVVEGDANAGALGMLRRCGIWGLQAWWSALCTAVGITCEQRAGEPGKRGND